MNKNPYEILHLQEDATYDQIKERYRHLTRTLHPDKQPVQNYQITKKLFEQIDEAYKSIASPLRRFLFREFGLPALKILDQMPNQFQDYEVEELSDNQTRKLKQLMAYMLYEKEACIEMEKTKFITKMLMNVTKTLKHQNINKNIKKNAKRNTFIPEIQNCTFEYEMILPQLYSFSNSMAISQFTNNIRNDPKYTIGLSLSSVRRIQSNYMLSLQSGISTNQSNIEIGIDKICQNNLQLKFTPISISNWQLNNPKIGLQKSFSGFQVSAVTDGKSFNLDFSESSQKKVGRSLKIFMQKGSLGLIPRIDFELMPQLKLFFQLNTSFQFQTSANNINLRPSIIYGYKLTLTQQLKLQFASSIGTPNYFQITFISNKFRVSIPMIAAENQLAKFQFIKVSIMCLTFAILQGFRFRQRRNRQLKEKLLKQQESRLNQQKRDLNRQISYVDVMAQDKKFKQIKYNGLVIIKAYLGDANKLTKMSKLINKINLQQSIEEIQIKIIQLQFLVGQSKDQVEDVTILIQSEVVGGQIIDFNLEHLMKFNPIIMDNICPHLLLLYRERGQTKVIKIQCKDKLNIGRPAKTSNWDNLKQLVSTVIGNILQ